MTAHAKRTVTFEGSTPILPVVDLVRSIDYYVKTLGFTLGWHSPGVIAFVSRGGCNVMLAEGDQGTPGVWVWVGASDVGALHEEYVSRGAMVRQGPTNFPWALEIQIADPDGNVLRFGSERIEGEPEGPWLDMRGDRWKKTTDGWRKQESPG